MASAYKHTQRVQRRCRREEQLAINDTARALQDVIVIAGIGLAEGRNDKERFKGALCQAFGLHLDNNDLNAKLEHSYPQLFNDVPRSFASGCKRGRLRCARVRQLAD